MGLFDNVRVGDKLRKREFCATFDKDNHNNNIVTFVSMDSWGSITIEESKHAIHYSLRSDQG
jgi:hypothetical protein